MTSSNPALAKATGLNGPGRVKLSTVVNRTGILVGTAMIGAGVAWRASQMGACTVFLLPAAIIGFVLGLTIISREDANPLFSVPYALCEGAVLGCLTYLAEQRYPSIGWQALAGTASCFGTVLFLYRTGILRASPMAAKVNMTALSAITLVALANVVGCYFGFPIPLINGNGVVGLIFSVVVIGVASLSFVFDFESVKKSVRSGTCDDDAWLLAFGLLVGLVWVYLEILRLLTKLRDLQ